MHTHRELEPLAGVLAEADEPLTAREILSRLDEHHHDEFQSAHRVATVLGRHADRGAVRVVAGTPYRYALPDE
jgi:predicted Zn-ribbon and HTH transcriptional regulator